MNGTDDAHKWDGLASATANTAGHRTTGYLVADLGAPFAQLLAGSNLDASKYYQYKVAFYDGTTYSYSNARSNVILTGSTVRDVTLTDIPLGPTGTTARYVYRTLDNASVAAAEANDTFYKIATISDNSTTTIADAMADGTADDDAVPTWTTVSAGTNVTPPKGKYATIHREKLFISGNSTYPSDIYWSENFLPDYFDPEDFEQVRPDDGDEITFMKVFLGILTIGKTNTIQKIYTDGADTTWTISSPFSFVGCYAPYSAQTTPKGIFYLGRDGLSRFTGQYSNLASDAVTPEITDILVSNYEESFGYYFNGNYYLAYTSQAAGGTDNNKVLVYNLTRDAYSIDTKAINVFEAFDSGDDIGMLYHGSSETDGYVYVDDGSTKFISTRLKSDFDLGTFDDARAIGTESNPELEISWDITIDEAVGTIDTHSYGASAIIDRPDTDGTWTSQIYNINARELEKMQWHENLENNVGDVTFQVRCAAASAGIAAASWSTAVTTPSGSDLTGLTADNYCQVRSNLSTTDITVTPNLYKKGNYVWKMYYQEAGSTSEPAFTSEYRSGWLNFGVPGYKKLITRIKVYYQGDTGSLTFNFRNDQDDVDRTFTIDLTVNPSASIEDRYEGDLTYKVFTHKPSENEASDNGPTGEFWQYTITENGTDEWTVYSVETMFSVEEVY